MRLTGTLRSWNEDRGFGFIEPMHGGAKLFVHVSAFPRDGSRPVKGESLTYELGRGPNGKPQAVSVVRSAIGTRTPNPRTRGRAPARSQLRFVLISLIIIMCAVYVYIRFSHWFLPSVSSRVVAEEQPEDWSLPSVSPRTVAEEQPEAVADAFRCDGRTYCSQMTSCAEATYFLKHCPGVKMDGNHDGVPCEKQWCE